MRAIARYGKASLRQLPGRKPQWRWNQKTGKPIRSKGAKEIDLYHYQKEFLAPKLLPFAKDCEATRPNTVVQENNAPAHIDYF